jgi:Na+/melibiose symporter-like transporter
VTIVMLILAVVLLSAFFLVERRVAHPLLPIRVLADRTRGGAFAGIGLAGLAMFALFLFLTYYLQATLGFTPIQTGLAFLPLSAAIIVTAQVVSQRLLPKYGPRPHMVVGMLLGAAAMLTLTQLGTDSSYATHVLPALILMGIGMGNIFPPAFQSATIGVDRADTGVASAMVNTMQQVGGSIGTALLSSIFASAVTAYADGRARSPELIATATVHGYTVAFWVAAGVFAVGAIVVGAVVPSIRIETETAGEPVVAH